MDTRIFAHRGASGYAPENTLEAFRLAVEQGADGVELDVHLTRDGHIIVTHDERIDRCSDGSGLVGRLTLKEIKKHSFSKPHPEYEGALAPTLEEVLELLQPTGMWVNVELKNGVIPYPGMEEKCVRLVEKMGMADRVLYSSFNHHSLLLLKRIKPDAPCGLLYGCNMLFPADYLKKTGVEALHPHYWDLLLHPEGYAEAKRQGGRVHVWTVNDDRDVRKCADAGADILITNYPDRALAALGRGASAR
ncbi:MAG TPA: glycerophosphodiester phosphodiesterase [Candidatus Limnocylindria bacterium]|nr:glycerophosphodiester phosphodiesterase [Candidatus Limnocylindria bacterium]